MAMSRAMLLSPDVLLAREDCGVGCDLLSAGCVGCVGCVGCIGCVGCVSNLTLPSPRPRENFQTSRHLSSQSTNP